jgi:hypothetical protein
MTLYSAAILPIIYIKIFLIMVKVKLPLFLNKHHSMKTYGGFLIWTLHVGVWSVPRPINSGTNCKGGVIGPRAILDTAVEG